MKYVPAHYKSKYPITILEGALRVDLNIDRYAVVRSCDGTKVPFNDDSLVVVNFIMNNGDRPCEVTNEEAALTRCKFKFSELEMRLDEYLMAPHAMTRDEMRKKFILYVRGIVDFWANESKKQGNPKEQIEGAIYTLLSTLDGSAEEFPRFKIIPAPQPGDREYLVKHGMKWFPAIDIGGDLRYLFERKDI